MPTTTKAVNIGAAANDGSGDTPRVAFAKLNGFNVCGQPYNAVGDGSADDRGAIALADAAAVAFGGGYVDFPPGTYRIASDLTITSTCRFAPGTILARDNTVNVTLNGRAPITPLQQIFNVTASGSFTFGSSVVEKVYPQWWGAVADYTTNDLPAIQAAVNSISGGSPADFGGEVFFPTPTAAGQGYYLGAGATGIVVTSRGVVLRGESLQTILKYAGAGDAILFTSVVTGANQNFIACQDLAVICTHAAANGIRMMAPRYARIAHCYTENGTAGTTGSGIVIDATDNTALNTVVDHCTASGFFKQIEFRGHPSDGAKICIECAIYDPFVRAQAAAVGTGTVGIEFRGASGCTVQGGGIEVVDVGVKLVSTPTACVGIAINDVRGESITNYDYDIPADARECVVDNFHSDDQIHRDLAPDTSTRSPAQSRINSTRKNAAAKTLANGLTSIVPTTLSTTGFAAVLEIGGPTGAFSIGGFQIPCFTGFADANYAFLDVFYLGAQQLTIVDTDATANASNSSIRTSGRANVVIAATAGGVHLRLAYMSAWPQWFLISHTP